MYVAGATTALEFVTCKFVSNSCLNGHGGAISVFTGSPSIIECSFVENEAQSGGALYLDSECAIVASTFERNSVSNIGGAVFAHSAESDARVELASCVFRENSAPRGGRFICRSSSSLKPTVASSVPITRNRTAVPSPYGTCPEDSSSERRSFAITLQIRAERSAYSVRRCPSGRAFSMGTRPRRAAARFDPKAQSFPSLRLSRHSTETSPPWGAQSIRISRRSATSSASSAQSSPMARVAQRFTRPDLAIRSFCARTSLATRGATGSAVSGRFSARTEIFRRIRCFAVPNRKILRSNQIHPVPRRV